MFKGFLAQQVMGIEPTCSAWKADILPLNYTCILVYIGVTGFEPAASWSQTRRSTKLSHTPKHITHRPLDLSQAQVRVYRIRKDLSITFLKKAKSCYHAFAMVYYIR